MKKMRQRAITWLALCLILTLTVTSLTGCMKSYKVGGKALEELESSELETYETVYDNAAVMLSQGSEEDLLNLSYSDADFSEPWSQWQAFTEKYGSYQSHEVTDGYKYGDDYVLQGTITLEDRAIGMDLKMNSKTKLTDLFFYELPENEEAEASVVPEGVEEVPIVVGEGTDYPLDGYITMPEGASDGTETYPAVVLVHGTGANDMDHLAGNTRMFRDLAYSLAQKGIVVIRYNKRTNTYGDEWSNNPTAENLSIEWETVEDAILASDLVKSQSYVDPDQVYVIGHSLGGLVSGRIDEEGGDFAGFILLSTPDREWQEAAFDQYLNYGLASSDMDSDDLYYTCSVLDSQLSDINKKLDSYSDSELLSDSLLGMPAIYWKNLNDFDYVGYYENTDKPILILQGSEDYQIMADEDFAGWQKKMEGHDNVTLKVYDGVNHLMMKSQGLFKGNAKEYEAPNHVSDEVITDIADFILE